MHKVARVAHQCVTFSRARTWKLPQGRATRATHEPVEHKTRSRSPARSFTCTSSNPRSTPAFQAVETPERRVKDVKAGRSS